MPITWLITAVLGFFAWGMDLLELTAYSIAGLFSSFEVLIIIFGAIVVMNTLKMSGGMVAINNGFRSISADARVQVLPFAMFAGACFAVPYVLVNIFVGYEFPALLGSLIALILVATRIPAPGIKGLLNDVNSIFVIRTADLFGTPNTAFTLKWAYVPGTVFILIALVTVLLHGMKALSKVGKGLYIVISPVIGVLGAFISGSNTVAVTLFANLQEQVASNLSLNRAIIVAANTIGGSIGNMICVNNVVAACATAGTTGKEGKIIRINAIPAAIYVGIVILVLFVAIGILEL